MKRAWWCMVLAALWLPIKAQGVEELFARTALYDESVPRPVHNPEKALQKPRGATTGGLGALRPTTGPAVKLTWAVERDAAMTPLLTDDDWATFERGYAPLVRKALQGTPDERRETSDALLGATNKAGISENVKRFLKLHALGLAARGSGGVAQRGKLLDEMIAGLQERTLAVLQAKLDCVALRYGGSDIPARLRESLIEAQLELGKLQVQAGFGAAALDNLKAAAALLKTIKTPPPELTDTMAESRVYIERGARIAEDWPRLREALKGSPKDPFANTQLAIAQLSVFHDIERGGAAAALSDKKELANFGKVVAETQLSTLTYPSAKANEATLALCAALNGVAKSLGVPADRYSVASLVMEKLPPLQEFGNLTTEQTRKAKALLRAAMMIANDTGVRPIRIPEPEPETPPETQAKSPPSFASVAEIFVGAPREAVPSKGEVWTAARIKACNAWLKENANKKILRVKAGLVNVEPPAKETVATFSLPKVEVSGQALTATLEAHLQRGEALRRLRHGAEVSLAGYITGVEVKQGLGGTAQVHIVVSDREPGK